MHPELYVHLPDWARPDRPVLRYLIQSEARRHSWLERWVSRVLAAGGIALLIALGYQIHRDATIFGLPDSPSSALYSILYFGLLIVQHLGTMVPLSLTANMVSVERLQGTWELLKITSHGAEIITRARWAAVFYHLRWYLLIVMVPRLVFTGQMLSDITHYQGRQIDLYLTGITPEVAPAGAILLIAALMFAALLQPLVVIGLNASFGLVLATMIRSTSATRMLRVILMSLQSLVFIIVMFAGWLSLESEPGGLFYRDPSDSGRWASVLLMLVAGDQSLTLMNLQTFLQTWTEIDYGILLGAAILVVTLVQMGITMELLNWAARRAARPSRG